MVNFEKMPLENIYFDDGVLKLEDEIHFGFEMKPNYGLNLILKRRCYIII